jgi:hypothetical protein
MPPSPDLILLDLGRWRQNRHRRRVYAATPCYECADLLPCFRVGMVDEPPSGPKSRCREQCAMFAIKAMPGAATECLQWFWQVKRHCKPQENTDRCWTRCDTTGIDTIAESGMCTAAQVVVGPQLVGLPWGIVGIKIKLSPLGRLGGLPIDRGTTVYAWTWNRFGSHIVARNSLTSSKSV